VTAQNAAANNPDFIDFPPDAPKERFYRGQIGSVPGANQLAKIPRGLLVVNKPHRLSLHCGMKESQSL
jgi:hypothetical protein